MRLLALFFVCMSVLSACSSYSPVNAHKPVESDSKKMKLAQAYLLLGRSRLAKRKLDEISKSAQNLSYWRLLSLYWLNLNNLQQAILTHKKALSLFPNDDFLLNNLGVLMGQRHEWREACQYFRQADSNSHFMRQSIQINLSRCSIRRNDIKLAIKYLKQAKEIADLPLIGLMTELNLDLILGNIGDARLTLNMIQANTQNVRESEHFNEYNCLSQQVIARETDPSLYSFASHFTCLNR